MALRGPTKPSHLRQVSAAGATSLDSRPQRNHNTGYLEQDPDGRTTPLPPNLGKRQCTLLIHDETFSREEFLFNQTAFSQMGVKIGDVVEILNVEECGDSVHGSSGDGGGGERSIRDGGHAEGGPFGSTGPNPSGGSGVGGTASGGGSGDRRSKFKTPMQSRCLFVVKPLPQDIKSRHARLEISVASSVANVFGFKNRSQVLLAPVDRAQCSASHVEICFRDQYLLRSDMWRLVMSELADKTVYKGQKILFLGSIKATVKNIFISGKKVMSGYFSSHTIPLFRSESAKYVLFIQMSREMWDFDSEGTGDILFSRVVDGFLPELFKRWANIGARHTVTIVLFTRVEYDMQAGIGSSALISENLKLFSNSLNNVPTRDFYRVVVNDMASGHWTAILDELKKDFRTFLRDVSILRTEDSDTSMAIGNGENSSSPKPHTATIVGRPSAALRGNILEAVHLASSHLAFDHIDRDMMRTGTSIVVITPGSGVFEASYESLASTTEALTNRGIAIDLVCVSQMPLHSVPLFKYRNPVGQPTGSCGLSDAQSGSSSSPELRQHKGSFANRSSHPSSVSTTRDSSLAGSVPKDRILPKPNEWNYGIPHWLDISYWNPETYRESRRILKQDPNAPIPFTVTKRSKVFVPRVRMYEIQMMGVMESEQSNISIPYLLEGQDTSRYSASGRASGSQSLNPARTFLNPSSSKAPLSDSLRPELLAPSISNIPRNNIPQRPKKQQESTLSWMDHYDDMAFRPLSTPSRASKRRTSKPKQHPTEPREHEGHSKKMHSNNTPKPKKSAISRSLSFALRGLVSTPPRAQASTQLNVEHATAGNTHSLHIVKKTPDSISSSDTASLSTVVDLSPNTSTETSPKVIQKPAQEKTIQETSVTPSRPISIRGPLKRSAADPENAERRDMPDSLSTTVTETPYQGTVRSVDGYPRRPPVLKFDIPDNTDLRDVSRKDAPSKALSPWVRSINPCNTSKAALRDASWFGRWQHAYPRPPHIAVVKWKSLKSPAVLPLTTEEFPSARDLESDYIATPYRVFPNDELEGVELPREKDRLLREMVSLRLARGFQLVVGRGVASVSRQSALESLNIFDRRGFERKGLALFLSKGNTIHRLVSVDEDEIEVTRYTHKPSLERENDEESNDSEVYQAYVRTILSKEYTAKELRLGSAADEYNWNYADNYVAGHRDYILNPTQQLHFWRVRYVLIPMQLNVGTRRRQQGYNELNEEEIHLEGIFNLARMWQRHNYIPREEKKKVEASSRRNQQGEMPLDIIFKTGNMSEVVAEAVAEERDGKLQPDPESDSSPTQLLPESELLERSSVKLPSLAQIIQSDKGVRIMDRRWHGRLHYNSFIGFELTTWLLHNFRDIESREQAVEYGSELFRQGLFEHVSKRHNFRDGNYFYRISDGYRVPPARPESRSGWFSSQKRQDKSVPTTPATESSSGSRKNSTGSGTAARGRGRSESSEDINNNHNTPTTPSSSQATPTKGKNRKTIMLSKSLKYDVDPRKRSYRPEVVDLHYDRVHIPDNCFHIELSWMITTPKLIEDSVASWASTAERFGLKLVQVPIGEASSVGKVRCFRKPYRVSLKVAPPCGPLPTVYNTTSFTAQTTGTPDKLYFHKALLRKFEFVLDFEASSAFPPDVEVSYSWGKPDYTCSQYIHRSGSLLAQITDEGEFLFLANRLVSARSSHSTGTNNNNNSSNPTSSSSSSLRPRSGDYFTSTIDRLSPHLSPFVGSNSSALSTPQGSHGHIQQQATPISTPTTPLPTPSTNTNSSTSHIPSFGLDTSNLYTAPEVIVSVFEGFCNDITRLEQFYAEPYTTQTRPTSTKIGPTTTTTTAAAAVTTTTNITTTINNTTTPTPTTNVTKARMISSPISAMESSIPSLELPARLVDNSGFQSSFDPPASSPKSPSSSSSATAAAAPAPSPAPSTLSTASSSTATGDDSSAARDES